MAYLKLHVTPATRRDAVLAWRRDALLLQVRAAPQKGRANQAALRLLARALGLPVSQLRLVRGTASRDKLVFIDGLSDEEVRQRLP